MMPAERLPLLGCPRGDQHPGHSWHLGRDEAWCDGLNADGTSPYDPARRGYQPSPPSQSLDPLVALDRSAREVKGHVTLHASYGPQASRHPEPDWSCQLVWATGQPEQPVLSFYGVGTSMQHAVRHLLHQIEEAVAAQATPPEEESAS